MRVADLGWETSDGWHVYPFSFAGKPTMPLGEVIELKDVLLNTVLTPKHYICYLWKDHSHDTESPAGPIEYVPGYGVILKISGSNAGHSLSEIISFWNYFADGHKNFDWVAVQSGFREEAKFIFSLLCQFIPRSKIKIIKEGTKYHFDTVTLRRNRWFNGVTNWRSIQYTKIDNVVDLHNLSFISDDFNDSPRFIMEFAKKLYQEESHKYTLSKKLLMLKTSTDPMMITANRAMHLSPSARDIATESGFGIFDIRDVADIEEYICVLHHADVVVFSYGAIACTNRFFLNENCTVILLANESYKSEYEKGNELWHPLHSHTFPVKRQIMVLDFPDLITGVDMARLMRLVDATLTEAVS